MSKKYLYAVRVEDCEVTFLRGDDSIKMPVTVFKDDHSSPAVFTNKAAAEKFCDEMQRLYPDTPYTVHKFLPQS